LRYHLSPNRQLTLSDVVVLKIGRIAPRATDADVRRTELGSELAKFRIREIDGRTILKEAAIETCGLICRMLLRGSSGLFWSGLVWRPKAPARYLDSLHIIGDEAGSTSPRTFILCGDTAVWEVADWMQPIVSAPPAINTEDRAEKDFIVTILTCGTTIREACHLHICEYSRDKS